MIMTREVARQFARDYNWEDTIGVIEDPTYAAETIASEMEIVDADVRRDLIIALVESAERENGRRGRRRLL